MFDGNMFAESKTDFEPRQKAGILHPCLNLTEILFYIVNKVWIFYIKYSCFIAIMVYVFIRTVINVNSGVEKWL